MLNLQATRRLRRSHLFINSNNNPPHQQHHQPSRLCILSMDGYLDLVYLSSIVIVGGLLVVIVYEVCTPQLLTYHPPSFFLCIIDSIMQLLMLSDLESDNLNNIDFCRRLNKFLYPEIYVHMGNYISSLFISILLLFTIPPASHTHSCIAHYSTPNHTSNLHHSVVTCRPYFPLTIISSNTNNILSTSCLSTSHLEVAYVPAQCTCGRIQRIQVCRTNTPEHVHHSTHIVLYTHI